MLPLRRTITVKNDLSEITQLLEHLERFTQEAGLSSCQSNAIILSLDEAIANTILHGYPDGGDHVIRIHLERESTLFTAIVEDEGIPFDPLDIPEVDFSLPLEDRPIGGLGIHCIRSFMDVLSYRREGNKNILTLIKLLCG